jgi:predicted nucleic-acid-binding protein
VLIADTNVLIRAFVEDDIKQSKLAKATLQGQQVAVPATALCELVWVLRRQYKIPASEITLFLRGLLETANIYLDRGSVSAGLLMMEAGGDFADGVIDYEGRVLGGDSFISFDKRAVRLLGDRAQLLG